LGVDNLDDEYAKDFNYQHKGLAKEEEKKKRLDEDS